MMRVEVIDTLSIIGQSQSLCLVYKSIMRAIQSAGVICLAVLRQLGMTTIDHDYLLQLCAYQHKEPKHAARHFPTHARLRPIIRNEYFCSTGMQSWKLLSAQCRFRRIVLMAHVIFTII